MSSRHAPAAAGFFALFFCVITQAVAGTAPDLIIPKLYAKVGKWVIGDNSHGECLAAAEVSQDLEMWLGQAEDGEPFLAFFNNNWSSLEEGKTYKVTQKTSSNTTWVGSYVAIQRVNSKGQKFKGLIQYSLSSDFLSQLSNGSYLSLSYGGNEIARTGVKETGSVLKELETCRATLARQRNDQIAKASTPPETKKENISTRNDVSESPQNQRTDSRRRVALIIGNGAYKNVPALTNPTRDADAVSKSLKSVGFTSVTEIKDQTQSELLKSLKEFAKDADGADWAVIYYSGHGIEVGGKNYLVPIDAQMKVDRDVELEAVDLDKILAAADGAKKLKLVVLDACRDNPFASQMRRSTIATRSIGRGLASVEPQAGTLVVYAAKHGEQALDGEGKNSPFAEALITHIQTPGLEVRLLFDTIRDDVMDTTQGKQQPFVYGSLSARERFYFSSEK